MGAAMLRAAGLAAAVALSPNALGASFDCLRASNAAERMICANPRLSQLDEYAARYYAGARLALVDAEACLRADQQEWLHKRNQCAGHGCIENAYLDRLAELHPLQPGATSLRNEALPERPGLVWIVAPAADKVAAPPNPKAMRGFIRGALLDEVSSGDGFVVRSASGERRLVAMLMFLDPATASRLSTLAREPDVTFLVSGHVAGEGAGKHFEPSRCTFIHRENAPVEGRILADPARAHPGFKPHELAFTTPRDGMARAEFRSVSFYAVILKTAERCSLKEAERREVQALFPFHKVFFPRAGCDEFPEENITYTNVDPKYGFLAVYAGATESEAREFLKKVNALDRFKGANVRRMQAVLAYP